MSGGKEGKDLPHIGSSGLELSCYDASSETLDLRELASEAYAALHPERKLARADRVVPDSQPIFHFRHRDGRIQPPHILVGHAEARLGETRYGHHCGRTLSSCVFDLLMPPELTVYLDAEVSCAVGGENINGGVVLYKR